VKRARPRCRNIAGRLSRISGWLLVLGRVSDEPDRDCGGEEDHDDPERRVEAEVCRRPSDRGKCERKPSPHQQGCHAEKEYERSNAGDELAVHPP